MNSHYKVENDEYFKIFASKSSRNQNTVEKYRKILTKFCKATKKQLNEIIDDCTGEQNIVTTVNLAPDKEGNERKREIRFDVNNKDSSINKYLNEFRQYCKSRNNKNVTINSEEGLIRSFLNQSGVLLPKVDRLEDDSADWYLLTKEDFNYILQDASLMQALLTNFLTSTGMRVGDAVSLKIEDFMKSTEQYHDYVDVEDFIDNAPDDMIGQWVFKPNKTIKDKVNCVTFNSTHTSNLILQHLRHLKNQYYPTKNKDKDEAEKLTISKKDPLFGSKRFKYKKALKAKSVADHWGKKNKKFRDWKINQIKQQIENGEVSEEDYDEMVSKIPKYHPHICRKFFSTIVSNNCGDIRVCALLEGHSDGLPNDKSYIKKSVEDIKEIYINNIHDALSLDNVETKIISNKETEELNKKVSDADKKIETLTNENIEKDKQIEELKQLIYQTREQVDNLSFNRNRNNIEKAISEYFDTHYREDILKEETTAAGAKKCVILCKLAYDLAIENESTFRDDDEYLDSLIKKAIVRYTLNPNISLDDKTLNADELELLNKHISLQLELIDKIKSNNTLWDLVKDDQITLKNVLANIIKKNLNNIDNLNDADKENMVQDILMEYLSVD
ncbi:tyrosine-type recombinase/integrase [uncultured Methanobrevibacter sp.]|uniref:tyrosine-type recombinase/integrase n=1 Tax=uncultured Methanobrevibacter sp. TaxID=253161 RepID=UPI0025E17709|nr:tyrosine-type recombinase/integrase [uncultured Methanobrevibacter sp.]